jgi:hypothetical protein
MTDTGRRQFIAKAAVAGAVAFTAPAIITITPAQAADLTSAPPGFTQPPTELADPVELDDPETGELPATGADPFRMVVAGVAATAGGAVLQFWSPDKETP